MPPQLQQGQADTLTEAEGVLDGRPLRLGGAPGSSERSLEVPFAAYHCRGAKLVLDLGFTFSSLDYLGLLLDLVDRGVDVRAYDIVTPARVAERYPDEWRARVMAVPFTQGDIRTVELPRGVFDACMCISTLEHIGFDEASEDASSAFKRGATREDAPSHRSSDTDRRVLDQFAHTLRRGGIAVITVPVGKGGPALLQDSKKLFTRQWEFEERTLAGLREHPQFDCIDERYFRETGTGWVQVSSPRDLSDVSSAERPHAAGCGLIALKRK